MKVQPIPASSQSVTATPRDNLALTDPLIFRRAFGAEEDIMWLATVESSHTSESEWGGSRAALLVLGYGQPTGVPYPEGDSLGYWEPELQSNSGVSVGSWGMALWGDMPGDGVTNYWDQGQFGFDIHMNSFSMVLDTLRISTGPTDDFWGYGGQVSSLRMGNFFNVQYSYAMLFTTFGGPGGVPPAVPIPTQVAGYAPVYPDPDPRMDGPIRLLLSQMNNGPPVFSPGGAYNWVVTNSNPPDGYFGLTGPLISFNRPFAFRDSQWGFAMVNANMPDIGTLVPYFVQDGMNVIVYEENAISAVPPGYKSLGTGPLVYGFGTTTIVGFAYDDNPVTVTHAALFAITRSGSTISISGPQVDTLVGAVDAALGRIDDSSLVFATYNRTTGMTTFQFCTVSGGTISVVSSGYPFAPDGTTLRPGDFTGLLHIGGGYIFAIACGFFECDIFAFSYNFSSGAVRQIIQTVTDSIFVSYGLEGQPDFVGYTQNGARTELYHFDGTTLHVSDSSNVAENAYRNQYRLFDAGRHPTPSVSPVIVSAPSGNHLVIWDWIAGDIDQYPYSIVNGPWEVNQFTGTSNNFVWHTGTLGVFCLDTTEYSYPGRSSYLVAVDWSTLI